jgi:hypothetical protein
MKKILRIKEGAKVRRPRMKEICELSLNVPDVDMKTGLIQALILIGLWHVKEVLEQEVKQFWTLSGIGDELEDDQPYRVPDGPGWTEDEQG